jgi:hypothetical protein
MLVRLRVPALLGIAAVLGCSDSTEPGSVPAEVHAVSGDAQVGTVGMQLEDPLEVRVLDSRGRALAGVVVVFSASQGDLAGGPVSYFPAVDATLGLSMAPAIQETSDAAGWARAVWTLGTVAGEQSVTVEVDGVDPVTFSATASPGAPAAVAVAGGDGQIDQPGAVLAASLAASVVDQFGNPRAGETVDWAIIAGGGDLSSLTGLTDSSGVASTLLTLGGAIGFNTVQASSDGLSSARFHTLALAMAWDDAVADTFSGGLSGNRVLADLAQVGYAWDADTLIIGLAFVDSVVSTLVGGANAMGGVLDFDIDLDSLTGIESLADRYRPGSGSTGMGVDIVLDMFADASGEFLIFNDRMQTLGSTTPDFRGRLLTMRVPAAFIGTGPLAIAVTAGTPAEPTDIAPNDSSYLVAAGGTPTRPEAKAPAGAAVNYIRESWQ